MMKKRKSIGLSWLPRVLTATIVLSVTCCALNEPIDDAFYDGPVSFDRAVYEGEWTVNKQVVDTACLVVGSPMRVRLPEAYLLSLYTPALGDAVVQPQGVATELWLNEQGYTGMCPSATRCTT